MAVSELRTFRIAAAVLGPARTEPSQDACSSTLLLRGGSWLGSRLGRRRLSRLRAKGEILDTIAKFIITVGPGPRTGSPASIILSGDLILVGMGGFWRRKVRHLQHAISCPMWQTKSTGLGLRPFSIYLLLD